MSNSVLPFLPEARARALDSNLDGVFAARRTIWQIVLILVRIRTLYRLDFEQVLLLLSCFAINFSFRKDVKSVVPASDTALAAMIDCPPTKTRRLAEDLCAQAILEWTPSGYVVVKPALIFP